MVTIKVDEKTLGKIENDYKDYITDKDIGYILFVAKTKNNIITAYNNKKANTFKVTIQGEDYLYIAKKYSKIDEILPKKMKENKESPFYIDVDQQIGSDEVGTGDFLGPIVVCAAYCDNETMKLVNEYKIQDSKKINDEKIREIVPLLLKKVFFEYKILTNEKYNGAYEKGFNINQIKCILHNFVLTKLHDRFPYVKNVYIDQFTPENKYYEALGKIDHITDGVVFKEKGESYFPSVALASCIARYFFLIEMDFYGKKLNKKIPYGAGEKVDEFALEYAKEFGLDALLKICKKNFANYKNISSKLSV